jgi:GLPGLI family protein
MKLFSGLIFILFFLTEFCYAQQRVVAECTVTYQISLEENNLNKEVQNALQQSSKTVYIKGNDSRVDLNSPSLLQSIIYDKSNGSAVIIREFGNNKFMTKLNSKEWKLANKQYDGMTIHFVNETKTILGYECKKAILNLKDSSVFNIYYATAIAPSVREFEYQFRDVPGFVLEFDVKEQGASIVRYKATKINLSPVQASKYDIPTSGYRLLN